MNKKKDKILLNQDLEYNPYLPEDSNFFDINKAELKIDFKKYKSRHEFSVIIPSFNKKDSLKFVLSNFFEQDYFKSKYEIIVIDDGSDDKTLESIKKIKPSCNFKYFYWPRKKIKIKKEYKKWAKFYNRVGPARNIGINNAQGEIILFNDADILVRKDCLKKHQAHHNKYANIIVRGAKSFLPSDFYPDVKKIADISFLDKIGHLEKNKEYYKAYDFSKEGWYRVITSNLSIRSKYLEKVNGFSRDFVFWGFEDVDLGYRLSKTFKLKFIWDDKIKVYHLHHSREPGNRLNYLLAFRSGTSILYNKYLDKEIIHIFTDAIKHRFG